jgi:hypothetical protein
MVKTVATNDPDAPPAPTVTVPGTVILGLLLVRFKVTPELPAG